MQAGDELVDIGFVVIEGHAGAAAGEVLDVQPGEQRLRAMVTGADADAVHVHDARDVVRMDAPTHEHDGINPSCGDELTLQLRVENNVIEEASFTGHGCAISQASADIMADLITGETIEEARRLAELFLAMIRGEQLSEEDLEDLDEAAQLQDISHMPARVKCAELAWRTLDGMLDGQANQ